MGSVQGSGCGRCRRHPYTVAVGLFDAEQVREEALLAEHRLVVRLVPRFGMPALEQEHGVGRGVRRLEARY